MVDVVIQLHRFRSERAFNYTIHQNSATTFISLIVYNDLSRRGLGDRRFAARRTGGKSGHHRTGWWITSTGREVRESATESKQPRGCRLSAIGFRQEGKLLAES